MPVEELTTAVEETMITEVAEKAPKSGKGFVIALVAGALIGGTIAGIKAIKKIRANKAETETETEDAVEVVVVSEDN